VTNQADLRAGDEDRDRTSAVLREAYAQGRLSNEEFQSRVEQAQQARTFGELAALTADLPAAATPTPVVPHEGTSADAARRRGGLRAAWGAWLGVSVLVNVIWLGTWITGGGDAPSYWPIWVMGPWGAAMLIATLAGGQKE